MSTATTISAAEALAAAINPENPAPAGEQARALVDWLVQDQVAGWALYRLLDLFSLLAQRGQLPARPANRNDLSLDLIAALAEARGASWVTDARRAYMAEQILGAAEAPAPAPVVPPAPPAPRYLAPADFDPRPLVGRLSDGTPVHADRPWCTVAGEARTLGVTTEVNGLRLDVDRSHLLCPDLEGPDGVPLAAVGRLLEVAQAGLLGELITLARHHCK